MAWNTILDARYKCKECNRYHIMNPQDDSQRQVVVSKLNQLKDFFEKKAEESKEKPGFNSIAETIKNRHNREISLQLIAECKACDRFVDHVNRDMDNIK